MEIENNRDEFLIEFNKKQNNGLNNQANNLWHKVEVLLGEHHGK